MVPVVAWPNDDASVVDPFQVALETHQRPRGPLHLLTVVGDLDMGTVADLQAAADHVVQALLTQGTRGTREDIVVVDLADLTFLDSSGLTALIALWRATLGLGGTLWFIRPRPQVQRLFTITGLDRVLPVRADLAYALHEDRDQLAGPRTA